MSRTESFVGGMNVPHSDGRRLNATVPLATLVVDDERLALRLRPMGRWLASDFEVALDQAAAAFRLRGRFLTSGVGIETTHGLVAYFWTPRQRAAVLAALARRGVHVDAEPRSAHAAWGSWVSWGSPVDETPTAAPLPLRAPTGGVERDAARVAGGVVLPTSPRWQRRLALLQAPAAVAIAAWVWTGTDSTWSRYSAVMIAGYTVAVTVAQWWRGRH